MFRQTVWLLRDAVRTTGRRLISIAGLQFTGQVLQIGALGVAITYAGALQAGGAVSLFGSSYDARSSIALLIMATVAVGGMLFLAAGITYASKFLLSGVMRSYEEQCTRDALKHFGHTDDLRGVSTHVEGSLDERTLLRIVTKDARYCGRVVGEAVLACVPLVLLIVASIVMLIIDWLPTVIILVCFILAGPFYMWAARRGSASMEGIEAYARDDALLKAAMIRRLNRSMTSPASSPAWFEDAMDDPISQAYLRAYEQRLRAAHVGIFVANIQIATTIAVIVLYFGIATLRGMDMGATLVTYILALTYAMASSRGVAKAITNIAVFSPSFRRYVAFMSSVDADQSAHASEPPTTMDIVVEGSIGRGESGCPLTRGTPLTVIAPHAPLSRLGVLQMMCGLLNCDMQRVRALLGQAVFVHSDTDPASRSDDSFGPDAHGVPPRSALGFESVHWDDLRRFTSEDVETVTDDVWYRLLPSTRFVFSLIGALERRSTTIVLEQKPYRKLSEHDLDILHTAARDQFIVLLYTFVPDRLLSCMGAWFVFVDSQGVRHIGRREDYDDVRPALRRRDASWLSQPPPEDGALGWAGDVTSEATV
ncbi:MAG: hypothetical protein AAF432_04225 [Planctomycetota bacterium]